MFRNLKRWFLPCKENGYEPRLLHIWPVALLLIVIVITFGAAQVLQKTLTDANNSLAAVVASVLVDLTNFDRADQGLHGLAVNDTLREAAQLKANDMAAKGYFAHHSPDGKSPWYWFGEAGYQFAYAGENLAVFFGDSEDVARAWMNSPSHRANILSSNFTEIGIATAKGYYQGQKTVFVVQMFGTPRQSAPIATLTSESAQEPAETQGAVSGESIETITEEDVEPTPSESLFDVIHQDETFIAVKGEGTKPVPSATSPEMQSTLWQRMLASPQTTLSYIYTAIAGIVGVALIFLIFFEIHIQKPRSIILGAFVLLVIGVLLYLSYTEAVVASADDLARLFTETS